MFSTYVVWYLFLAGAASGCYLIASSCAIYNTSKQTIASARLAADSRYGFVLAPLLLLFSTLFLVIDLGSPERMWLVFLKPFDSVIAIGACCVALFMLLSIGVLLVGLVFRFPPKRFLFFCWVAGGVLSIGTMVYTGVFFASMVSIDFWNTPLVPVLFVLSSFNTGLGVILCSGVLSRGAHPKSIFLFRHLVIVGSSLELITLAVFLCTRYWFSAASRLSCDMLFSGELAFVFWFGMVFLGLLLPLLLQVLYSRIHSVGFVLLSSIGVLVGGLSLRYCIVGAAVFSAVVPGGFL